MTSHEASPFMGGIRAPGERRENKRGVNPLRLDAERGGTSSVSFDDDDSAHGRMRDTVIVEAADRSEGMGKRLARLEEG
jgi:hypothetical protein